MADGASEDEVVDLTPGLRIRIRGLATRPELNGQLGTLQVYDESRRRWKVDMDAGGVKLFKLANLEPAGGASVEQAVVSTASPDAAAPTVPDRPRAASTEAAAAGDLAGARSSGGEEPAARQKLRPGAQVAIRGLPGSGRGSFNGRIGVCEYFEFNTGRWHVRFEDNRMEAFKPDFLQLQASIVRAGAYVRLEGLQGAAHLNGKVGICENMDAEAGRWKVRLESGELKALKPENLALLEGYRAPEDETPVPGQGQSRHKVVANKDFCQQMEEMLESGEMQWMDC